MARSQYSASCPPGVNRVTCGFAASASSRAAGWNGSSVPHQTPSLVSPRASTCWSGSVAAHCSSFANAFLDRVRPAGEQGRVEGRDHRVGCAAGVVECAVRAHGQPEHGERRRREVALGEPASQPGSSSVSIRRGSSLGSFATQYESPPSSPTMANGVDTTARSFSTPSWTIILASEPRPCSATHTGSTALRYVEERQAGWAKVIAERLPLSDLRACLGVLRDLGDLLEEPDGE